MIDNFSELCNSFSEQETQRLREILSNCSEINLIGATAGTLEASFHYQQAFYEFFRKYSLSGLNQEETQELLLQLARINYQEKVIQPIIKQHPGRVETLRILTGGVVRTIVLLFEIFIDQDNGGAIHDLEKILDRVTPLYKHRMDELPAMQREVVTTLAINWDGMTLPELARSLRRSEPEVAVTLAKLKEFDLIEIKVVDTQMQWYFLQERFFNIWYLMRLATGAKTRVIWLVRFLEAWCNKKQLSERAKSQIGVLSKPEYSPKAAYYFAEALVQTGKLDWKLEYELTIKTREFLELRDTSLAQELSILNYERVGQVVNLIKSEKYEQAKDLLLQIKQPDGMVYLGLGNCCYYLKNFIEAEHYFLMAINKGNVDAMYNLAMLYRTQFKDYHKAEYYYLIAIKREDDWAMRDLGWLYHSVFKDYHKAKDYYLMAINKGNDRAMRDLGWLCHAEFKNYLQAERYYLRAIDQGNVIAMNDLALLYKNELKDYPQAERYFLRAIDQGNVDAIRNLAGLYYTEVKNYSKAEDYFLMAIDKGDKLTLNFMAWDYFQKKIHKHTALCCAKQAIENNQADNIAHTLACIYVWHNRFAEAVEVAKIFINKEDFYRISPKNAVSVYLLLLLAKQQYVIVRDYFENLQLTLKDRFKPIYYAFLKLTNNQAFGGMPPEVDETVTQILAEIQILAADYA